jgi:hypothetical protein
VFLNRGYSLPLLRRSRTLNSIYLLAATLPRSSNFGEERTRIYWSNNLACEYLVDRKVFPIERDSRIPVSFNH